MNGVSGVTEQPSFANTRKMTVSSDYELSV
jgi:hypothetical protein